MSNSFWTFSFDTFLGNLTRKTGTQNQPAALLRVLDTQEIIWYVYTHSVGYTDFPFFLLFKSPDSFSLVNWKIKLSNNLLWEREKEISHNFGRSLGQPALSPGNERFLNTSNESSLLLKGRLLVTWSRKGDEIGVTGTQTQCKRRRKKNIYTFVCGSWR